MSGDVIFAVGQVIIFFIMTVTALYAVSAKDLLLAVVALAAFSLLLSLEFFILQAPDVAIAEAAVGAGLTTAIYIFAIKETKRREDELYE